MGLHTWQAIGKPLPERLNIVLSRTAHIEQQPNVLLLRSREETLALSKYLNCDIYIIGGAKTYENFADVVDKWIVTSVPLSIEDADTFMPQDFLDGFASASQTELGEGLVAREFIRRPH